MKLEYKLASTDYLEHQLYLASKSGSVKKKRRINRLVVPVIYIGIALYDFSREGSGVLGFIFLFIAILWFLLYPLYSRKRYKKHYLKHIEEHYKNLLNRDSEIVLNPDYLLLRDNSTESKVSLKEIECLVELKERFLIKLRTGLALIVPKKGIPDLEAFRENFKMLDVEFLDETHWEWR